MRKGSRLVALLSDFGTRDWYAATLKAVILSRCPRACIVDITHEIPPQDVTAGAVTLAAAAPWFPKGSVFLAVVDPGVGSSRGLLAIRANGRYFVGPDNGLLAPSLKEADGLTIVRLTNRRYWLKCVSQTFHARDIMAPAAAHLACGGSLAALGTPARHLAPLALPEPRRHGRTIQGQIIHLDAFGNLITNLPESLIQEESGKDSRAILQYQRKACRVVSSYAKGEANELIAVVNSLGLLEIAISNGSAAWTFGAKRGEEVTLKVK
jgi:S-adenosylmethionine hydrolase